MNYIKFSERVFHEYYKKRDGPEIIFGVDPALALVVGGVVLDTVKIIKGCGEVFDVVKDIFRKPTEIQVSILRKKISDEVGNDKDLTDSILFAILETSYKLSSKEIQDLMNSIDD